jgi:hypothetical protein
VHGTRPPRTTRPPEGHHRRDGEAEGRESKLSVLTQELQSLAATPETLAATWTTKLHPSRLLSVSQSSRRLTTAQTSGRRLHEGHAADERLQLLQERLTSAKVRLLISGITTYSVRLNFSSPPCNRRLIARSCRCSAIAVRSPQRRYSPCRSGALPPDPLR